MCFPLKTDKKGKKKYTYFTVLTWSMGEKMEKEDSVTYKSGDMTTNQGHVIVQFYFLCVFLQVSTSILSPSMILFKQEIKALWGEGKNDYDKWKMESDNE